jgi:hypothetical protein
MARACARVGLLIIEVFAGFTLSVEIAAGQLFELAEERFRLDRDEIERLFAK